jgi:hypothetical protein
MRASLALLVGLSAFGCSVSDRKGDVMTSINAPAPPAVTLTPASAPSRKAPPAAKPEQPEDDAPRLYSKTRFVWIRPEPTTEFQWIGFLWTGGSVKLKSDKPIVGPGCNTWYAIEPRGYVCADGRRVTLDKNDPGYQALRRYAADTSSPFPHRYAESRGTPLYAAIPPPEKQRQREFDLVNHLKRVSQARQGTAESALAGVDLTMAQAPAFELPEMPASVREPRDKLLPRSTVAYSAEVAAHDRSWLLTHDMRWIPKDRVVPFAPVHFKGAHLGKDAELPLGFFRAADRSKYVKDPAGRIVAASEQWQRLSFVELTDREFEQDGDIYVKTRKGEYWVKKSDAVIPTPMPKTPWGAAVGATDETGAAPKGRATWIEVSVWGGWLIAYEGTKPIFVTLISPGRGGTPLPGKDPLETSATPTGRFPISGKFITATMEAPNEYIHSAVPWTQNFSGPYALHGAYWHDKWGTRQSGGCVNVSPTDGRWLFEFTDPKLPEGWHGVRWLPKLGPATIFIVHD